MIYNVLFIVTEKRFADFASLFFCLLKTII
nr:MAG TPA: hypothetical protein [Caudoviricetes sp.]